MVVKFTLRILLRPLISYFDTIDHICPMELTSQTTLPLHEILEPDPVVDWNNVHIAN